MSVKRNSAWIPIRDRKHLEKLLDELGQGNYLAYLNKPFLHSRYHVLHHWKISNGFLTAIMGHFLNDDEEFADAVLAILPENELPKIDCPTRDDE